jgi:hypothetical protein
VAQPSGTTNITNCIVSIIIHSNVNGDGTHGGIVARLSGNTTEMNITGCVFNGRLFTNNGTHSCSGFVGWWDQKTANIINSLYAPDANITPGAGETAINDGATFIRDENSVAYSTCYYTETLGVAQGTQAYAFSTAPANLGSLVQNYGMMTAYENGILYDGKYYVAPATISLANAADNTTTITAADGYIADVTLNGRTLYKDGDWNTICLPFNVTLAGSPLAGAVARPLNSASIEGTTLNLTFGDAVSTLTAGTPYMIKWDADANNIENPVFNNVTIDKTDRSYDNGASDDARVRFLGTYKSMEFNATDNSILLMGAENTLYYPTSGASLRAQRAYFKIGDGAQARSITGFNINFGEGDNTTKISTTNANHTNSDAWYDMQGRKLDGKPTTKGIYVNGNRKVVIK